MMYAVRYFILCRHVSQRETIGTNEIHFSVHAGIPSPLGAVPERGILVEKAELLEIITLSSASRPRLHIVRAEFKEILFSTFDDYFLYFFVIFNSTVNNTS